MIRLNPVVPLHFLLVLVIACCLSGGARADAAPAPDEVLAQVSQEMLSALRAEQAQISANPERVHQLVETIVVPHLNFERMSQWVLGKHWRHATPAQRSRFVAEFRQLLIRSYAGALIDFGDSELRFLDPKPGYSDDEVIVRAEVMQSGGPPIAMHYTLHRDSERWRVYDISVEGISLVVSYRSNFAREIRNGGLDDLIHQLVVKNNRMVAGGR